MQVWEARGHQGWSFRVLSLSRLLVAPQVYRGRQVSIHEDGVLRERSAWRFESCQHTVKPSVSAGSTSTDSTDPRSQIFREKKFQIVLKSKT